jgi:hypothetical protein
MKSMMRLSGAALTAFALFTASNPAPPPTAEYQRAVAVAERYLRDHHQDLASLTLVSLRKTLIVPYPYPGTPAERAVAQLGGQWQVEYLLNTCLDKQGLRACKGGGLVVTVNLRTNSQVMHGLE